MRITKQVLRQLSRTSTLLDHLEFDWWGRKATVQCYSDGFGRDKMGMLKFTLDDVEVFGLQNYTGTGLSSADEDRLRELIDEETDLGLEFTLPLSDELMAMLNRTFENHVESEEFGIEA